VQLILIRHGDAGYHIDDSLRALTVSGQAQAGQTAAYIANNFQPDAIISSPYVRAQQTAQLLSSKLKGLPVSVFEHITPTDNHGRAIDFLQDLAEKQQLNCVAVVCHMDIVSRICSALTGDIPLGFSLAEARVLEQNVIADGLSTQVTNFIPDASIGLL